MKVAFHLRRRPTSEPAKALLLPSHSVRELLELCARLGSDPLPPIYAVSEGFLLVLNQPVAGGFPPAIRLREMVRKLYVPADAELVPALLDDEAEGLVRQRGLVFLPGGRVLGFDLAHPVPLSALLSVDGLRRREWSPLPAPRPQAERLEEVALDLPEPPLEDLLAPGESDIGTEEPRPEEASGAATALGSASLALGRGLVRLGNALGLRGLADLGARMIQRAMSLAPRLSEAVLGRQEAALRALLRDFREGNLERALRRALPFAEPGGRGRTPTSSSRLPDRNPVYSLHGIVSSSGPAGIWFGGEQDVWDELAREYRKAAEQAARRGDYRRAAYIYGVLLRDYRLAANTLLQGGLAYDAAIIYLTKVGDSGAAARAFEAAGAIDRAVELYRRQGEHVQAGDLLRRAGEEHAALVEYRLAAEKLVNARQEYHSAGELLLAKTGRVDLALPYFQAGWARREGANVLPEVFPCGLRLADLYAQEETPEALLALVAEADDWFHGSGRENEAGQFYNRLAHLADRSNLAAVRDELRDRALMGLAAKLRQRAAVDDRPGHWVGALLGRSGAWAPALVRDAQLACKREPKSRRPLVPETDPNIQMPTIIKMQIGTDTVTAVCMARTSGDVFLGFHSGAIVCFRPVENKVIRLPIYPLPVTALAADEYGKVLVVVQEEEGGAGQLASFTRSADGSFRAVEARPLAAKGPFRLTNVLTLAESQTWVCGWDQEEFTYFRGPLLAPAGRFALEEAGLVAGFVLPFLQPQEVCARVLLFGRDALWTPLADGDVLPAVEAVELVRAPLGWTPVLPPDCPLRSVPLAWMQHGHQLEVFGLGEGGCLRWMTFALHPNRTQQQNQTGLSSHEGYLAGTILRSGFFAGVRRSRIDWLRCSDRGWHFTVTATTPIALPKAVACFSSPATQELIVVCAEGFVARVPVPS